MRLILAVVTLAAIVGVRMTAAAPAEDEAAAIGQKWLTLLDDQKYEDSWRQAGAMFRGEVSQEQWLQALKRSREPLGAMVSRATARVDFSKTLRGAPDGDYAIIHYTTDFKNKSGVTERLTLVKENDKWEMAAYAIH